MKCQGLVTLYNGLDILQTKDYIKVSCETYIIWISNIHLNQGWMNSYLISDRPTPLPTTPPFMKALTEEGDPDPVVQRALKKKIGFSYWSGIGQLVYAMVCCHPDLSFATVKLSQHNTCPGRVHFEGVHHTLKYLYQTRSEGLYFWRTTPRPKLKSISLQTIHSNENDLLRTQRQQHDALIAHGMSDTNWASCICTQRSFTGSLIKLPGAAVAYKTQLQDTIATSSTESEFMAAYKLGKMLIYVRSILWDLIVPQEAASWLYKDNNACTAMANGQKPTSCTQHMDIRYHILCEWVERDLIVLERVNTTINEANHFTKILSPVLFHRHIDYIMGHVPPEYSPAYTRSTGQFNKPVIKIVPDSYTTKETMPLVIPTNSDDLYIPIAARAARIYTPDYSTITNIFWTKIVASACLPYNPISHLATSNCGGVLAYIGLTT